MKKAERFYMICCRIFFGISTIALVAGCMGSNMNLPYLPADMFSLVQPPYNQMNCKRLQEEYEDLVIDRREKIRTADSFREESSKLLSAAKEKNCNIR